MVTHHVPGQTLTGEAGLLSPVLEMRKPWPKQVKFLTRQGGLGGVGLLSWSVQCGPTPPALGRHLAAVAGPHSCIGPL